MSVPFWRAPDATWDFLYFDDFLLPGICTLSIDKGRAVQIDKSKDENGNTLTDNGYEGAKISGALKICGPDDDVAGQLLELERAMREFDPASSNGVARPIVITHPQATLHNVRSIYAVKWGSKTPTGDDFIVTFEALEWFPAPKPVKKGGAGGKDQQSGWLDPFLEGVNDAIGGTGDFLQGLGGDGGSAAESPPNYDVPAPNPVGEGAAQP